MTDQDPVLAELRVKPSMNGLVATVHGMPTNMTGVATGILTLISLTVCAILSGLGLYMQSLSSPEALYGAAACFILVGVHLLSGFFGRRTLRAVRDIVAEQLLPSQKSVTVLELTPRRLLINRTSEIPIALVLTDITAVRNDNGVLILEGDPEHRIDASLNSAEAAAWLHAELSTIIQSTGQPSRPPQALQEMLNQVGPHE